MASCFKFTVEFDGEGAVQFTTDAHHYVGYFEDEAGLQYLFVYDFKEDESRLYIGHDVSQGNTATVMVWQGMISDYYIDGYTRIWLAHCLAVVKARRKQ